jgi:hypothetical protein
VSRGELSVTNPNPQCRYTTCSLRIKYQLEVTPSKRSFGLSKRCLEEKRSIIVHMRYLPRQGAGLTWVAGSGPRIIYARRVWCMCEACQREARASLGLAEIRDRIYLHVDSLERYPVFTSTGKAGR